MFDRLKSLFAKPSPPEYRDPELGSLKFDGDLWEGSVQQRGRELRFYLAGTETAPNAVQLVRARSLLASFSQTEGIALEFLRGHESELRQARLDFYSFDFPWEGKPDDFALEFLANGDDSGVWRVEFVDGKPSHSGYDD